MPFDGPVEDVIPKVSKEGMVWLRRIQDFNSRRDAEVGLVWSAIDTLAKQGVVSGNWDCLDLSTAHYIQQADVAEIIETTEAGAIGARPKFLAKSPTAGREHLARVIHGLMRTDWEMSPTVYRNGKLCVRDCSGKGQAVMLTECITDYDKAKIAKKKRDAEARARIENPALASLEAQIQEQAALLEDATPGDDDYFDTYLQNQNVRRDLVSSVQVPIESFFRDPARTKPEEWTWMGQTLIADYDALVRDPYLYVPKNLKPDIMMSLADLETGGPLSGPSPLQQGTMKPDRQPGEVARLITIHKMWALSHDDDGRPTWDGYILCKGAKKPLLKVVGQYDMGCPFSVLQWNERGSVQFPISDVMKALPNIIAKRDTLSRMFEKMSQSATPTMIYDKADVPNPNDLRQVIRTATANYVGIDNRVQKEIAKIFHELRGTGVTQDDLAYLQVQVEGIQSATGNGNNQFQKSMKSSTSASEAMEVSSRSDARAAVKPVAVGEFLSDVAKKRVQLMCQFYDKDRIRKMVGPEAAAFWARQEFTPGNIQELLISVEKGSLQEETDESKAAKLLGNLQMGFANPIALLMMNAQEMLAEVFMLQGFPDGSRFLRQLPPDTIDQLIIQQLSGAGGEKQGSPPAQKNGPQRAIPDGGTAA